MDVTHEDGQVENQGRYLPHDTRDDEIGADPLRILDVATAAGLQIATLSRNLHRRDVEELELAGFRQLPAHLITDADQSIMLVGLSVVGTHALAAGPIEIGIGYLGRAGVKSKLSLVEQPAENDGIAGARLAIEDNNTTGRFLNQHFTLEELRLKESDDVAQAAVALASRNGFIVADLPADALLKAADALRGRETVLLNAGSIDDRLREQDCRSNVLHVAPTRSMLADALAQYLVWKQWKRWLLVVGSHEADKLYAEVLRRAAARFGAKIVQERVFEDTGGARRTDSGVTLIQRQMPVLTQQAPAYDVLVAADRS